MILLGPQSLVMQEVVALLAGSSVGSWLLRFSPPWGWLASLVLVLSLVLCLVLARLELHGGLSFGHSGGTGLAARK